MDHKIDIPDTDYEVVESYNAAGFTKMRLKTREATLDVSIVEDVDFEDYIEQRKDELKNKEIDLPSPYTSKIKNKQKSEDAVEFPDGGGYGLGYAGPEFRLVTSDDSELARYRYYVTWKEVGGAVVEIEAYVDKEGFEQSSLEELVDRIEFS